jgi:hypothetical protein
VSSVYAIWNYQTKEVDFLHELPSDYVDYISPDSVIRHEKYVAQGDSPIEAAAKVWSAGNAAHEQDQAILAQIEAGRRMGEALGVLKPDVPPQPRPNVTNDAAMNDTGCLWVALMIIGLSALFLAAILSLNAAWPWLERVGSLVYGWVVGHAAAGAVAATTTATAAFGLAWWLDERDRR